MDHRMHWWFPLAAALEHGWDGKDAMLFARANQSVDTNTYRAHSPEDGVLLPNPTQAEMVDGIYGAVERGFHSVHCKLVKWHFPTPGLVAGPCKPVLFPNLHGMCVGVVELGMDCHAILDSRAHWDFRGYAHPDNRAFPHDLDSKSFKIRVIACLQPNRLATGHSEYMMLPDTMYATWKRRGQVRDNRVIYLQAGLGLWNMLCSQTGEVPVFLENGKLPDVAPSCLQALERCGTPDDFEQNMREIIYAKLGVVPDFHTIGPEDGAVWERFVIHAG